MFLKFIEIGRFVDAKKNTINNGRGVFAYDLKNNLIQATVNGVVSTYAFDALNQRVSKTVGGVVTRFIYDEAGGLAGEYDGSGSAQVEHIYFGDLPVGVSVGGAIHRVHTDYLGTPRVVTQGSAVVWKWASTDPFGGNAPSVASIVYNPRFPGQYFDAETGLHHNKHRAYDPQLGRYMQPDPLGLAAGKNPFNYVNQNPLNGTDPEGLKDVELEIIHIIDNSINGFLINHVAVYNPKTDHVLEAMMGNNDNKRNPRFFIPTPPFLSAKLGVSTFENRNEFFKKYNGLQYESIVIRVSEGEAEMIEKSFNYLPYTSKGEGSTTYGVGNGYLSCVSAVDLILTVAGVANYSGERYPIDYFGALSNNLEIKKRLIRKNQKTSLPGVRKDILMILPTGGVLGSLLN